MLSIKGNVMLALYWKRVSVEARLNLDRFNFALADQLSLLKSPFQPPTFSNLTRLPMLKAISELNARLRRNLQSELNFTATSFNLSLQKYTEDSLCIYNL